MRTLTHYIMDELLNKRVGVLHTKSEVGSARLIGIIHEVGTDFIVLMVGSTPYVLRTDEIVILEPKE